MGDGEMKKSNFFYATYFNHLKRLKTLFFCPSLVTIILQKKHIFFPCKLNTLKKSLAYNMGE